MTTLEISSKTLLKSSELKLPQLPARLDGLVELLWCIGLQHLAKCNILDQSELIRCSRLFIIAFFQCVNRPAVCVAVMLLLAVAHGKRACDYSEIISTYRAVILVELQNLVSVRVSDNQNPRVQTDYVQYVANLTCSSRLIF